MITLKEWNNLPQSKRDKASRIVFYNMPDWYQENMAKEWHHRLDAEHKVLLSSIYKKEGNNPYYTCRPPEEVL